MIKHFDNNIKKSLLRFALDLAPNNGHNFRKNELLFKTSFINK